MSKEILFLIITVLIVLFQNSFLYDFTFLKSYLNIILVSVVFITLAVGYQKGFIFAVIAGLLLDIYSPYNFGIFTIALITPVFLIYYLFKKFLAQRSIYSLIIAMAITTITFHLIIWLLTNLFYWFNWNTIALHLTKEYIFMVIGQIIIHSLIISLFFSLTKFINKKIRTKFLTTEGA